MSDASHGSTDQQRMIAEMAELAGGLAHELRNPLSTMMVNLKLLSEDLADTDVNFEDVRRRAIHKVDILRHEAERLQSLFDEFLNLAGPCRLSRKPTDLNAVVDRLVEFFEPLAHSQGVTVHTVRSGEAPHVMADENLIRQALLNIVVNAQQAMPDGGAITIETASEDDAVRVSVSDAGVGISDADRERILRPFISTKPGGNGLGLSITQRIIHEHGGKLTLTSEIGRGTTVTITLPRGADSDSAGQA